MKDYYASTKKLDRILYNVPIDYLSFVRLFAWEGLVAKVAKTQDPTHSEMISYHALTQILLKMGMIPFNGNISTWAKDNS